MSRLGACAAAFLVTGFVLYAGALEGPFVSDDFHYVVNNPFVNGSASARGILDPGGEAVTLVENYAPVHLLLHRAAWGAFGPDVWGHHVLNLVLHAAASLVLVLLLRRSGLRDAAAAFGGALFLVHPANVEAVAWISQLKSSASLTLAGLALLALERRPALASGAFALALLAKPTAAFALPVAAVLWWLRGGTAGGLAGGRGLRWLALWLVLFLGFAAVELGAFSRASGAHIEALDPDPWVRLRTSVAFAGRYLAMATTTWGLSAFHEPQPAISLLDPWWLLGLAAIGAIGARTVHALRLGREEAAWWVWAGVSFLPVAQFFPFPYPLADRYLYTILPGLLGGALLAMAPALERLGARAPRASLAAALVVLALFAVRAHGRVDIWRSSALLQADAARHYPDGVSAHLLRARRAAMARDVPAATGALRAALERGYDRFDAVLGDPLLGPLAGTPEFDAVVSGMAGRWVERLARRDDLAQAELLTLALAHRVRGEDRAAILALERGLARGGPLDPALRRELRRLGHAPSGARGRQPAKPR